MSYQDNIEEARKLERQARQLRKKAKLKEKYVSDNLDQYVGNYYVVSNWRKSVVYVKEVNSSRKSIVVEICYLAYVETSYIYLSELNDLIPTTEEHFNKVKSIILEYESYRNKKLVEIQNAILNRNE